MNNLLIFLIVIACALLALVILVQNPKSGGLSSTLGGSQGSQMFGVQRTTDFLTNATFTIAGIVAVVVLIYNLSNSPDVQTSSNDAIEQPAPAKPNTVSKKTENSKKSTNP